MPGMFLELEKLPLTSNGKVNRQGLPLPEMGMGKKGEHVGPRTEVEKALVEIWGEVLGVEQVGVYDDFFRLGGDSVQAMRILVQIHRRFQWFTVSESAGVGDGGGMGEGDRREEERGGGEGVESLPMIEAGEEHRYEPFALTDVQQAYWIGRLEGFSWECGDACVHGDGERGAGCGAIRASVPAADRAA